MNIYLIGYRGTGKSTVAPLLADRLGRRWWSVDLDEVLQQRAGQSIAEIFAKEGEQRFRDREQEILNEVARRDHLVVATGGGVIGREVNRRWLKRGRVVWLSASLDAIMQRLAADEERSDQRPDLTAQGGRDEIQRLLAEREPVYRGLAELTLATDELLPEEVAQTIVETWPDLGNP